MARQHRRIRFESLEDRRVMAVDFSLDNGVLTIEGDDDRANAAFVEIFADSIEVDAWQYDAEDGPFNYEDPINHRDESYEIGEVDKIIFLGGDVHNNFALFEHNSGMWLGESLQIEFYGGEGVDRFQNATSGASRGYGYGQRDFLIGGSGRDFLYGGDGGDFMAGAGDNDYLDGGNDADWIQGDEGNDRLYGRGGNDGLDGGGNDDTLDGGSGNDLLYGNANFVQSEGELLAGSQEHLDLGLLFDTINNVDGVTLSASDFDAALQDLFGGAVETQLENGEANASWDGNDRLRGGSGNDVLYGGAGNDSLRGGSGSDLLLGGSGNDYLNGEQGDDVLRGGDGRDELQGASGADVLYGGFGNDYLHGGYDLETDTLFGGDGIDRFVSTYRLTKHQPYRLPTVKLVKEELIGDLDGHDQELTVDFVLAEGIQK